MKNQLRLLSGIIAFVGAGLLMTPERAFSTATNDVLDPLGRRFCCGYDSNGDGKADSYCCYDSGCSSGPRGCVRAG
jgi:hypothetical protein